MCIRNKPTLDDERGLGSEPSRIPNHQVCQLADLDATNDVAEPLRESRVDGVFADISLDSEVVGTSSLVFSELASL